VFLNGQAARSLGGFLFDLLLSLGCLCRGHEMNNFLRYCVVAVHLGGVAAHAFSQFEGVIESKNLTTDETGAFRRFNMTMWIKKDMARIQTSGEGVPVQTMIYRRDLQTVWVVQYEDKTYFQMSQDDEQAGPPPEESVSDRYSLRKTGKTKKILGYPCEQVLITRGDEKTEIYGTKKLAHVSRAISRALGEDNANAKSGWTNELATMGIFPLFSSTRIGKNTVESQEITRIDARKIDAS
jgi:hypothetical protein